MANTKWRNQFFDLFNRESEGVKAASKIYNALSRAYIPEIYGEFSAGTLHLGAI